MTTKKPKKPPAKAKRKPRATIAAVYARAGILRVRLLETELKLGALSVGQKMLSEQIESLRVTAEKFTILASHAERLLREKETLQKALTMMHDSEKIRSWPMSRKNSADEFASQPLKAHLVPEPHFNASKEKFAADVYNSAFKCDHDILSPRSTIKILDGKRWCSGCQAFVGSITYSVTSACGFSATHVTGVKCNVCGETSS